MKKTKYIYKHSVYGGGPNGVNDEEVKAFFEESGVKLHGSKKDDYFYSWEFAGNQCSWFTFSHSEEVEISETVTKLPPADSIYKNGYNWKATGSNARLRAKKNSSLEEEKAKRDAEFFKMKEEFLKKRNLNK